MWTRRYIAGAAFAASLLVYAIPLIGPHTITFLGELFFQTSPRRDPLWRAAEFGSAFALQTAAFVLFYWFLRKPGIARGAITSLGGLGIVLTAHLAYLIFIPSFFLIENDRAPATGNWPVECFAEDAWISPVPMPHRDPANPVPEVLVQTSKAAYATMSIPGCAVRPLALPQPTVQPGGHVDFILGVDYLVPGAAILFNRLETQTGRQTWAVLRSGETEIIPIEAPPSVVKILSNDGEWVGWIETLPNSPPPVLERIVIRNIAAKLPDIRVDLGSLGPAIYTLDDIDVKNSEIRVWRNNELMLLDLNGEVRSSAPRPDGVEPLSHTYRKVGDGWIAWDAYRDEEPYRVAWSLPAGKRLHRVLKGRSINSVAVTPSADLIAISVASRLNIGRIKDAVYVLRASDGAEVFRQYLPLYTRTQVLFPTNETLLYSTGEKTLLVRIVR